MATGLFVAYYRTSTAKQSLGIEAQREAVTRFLNGGDWQLVGEFEEHESGKNDARPALVRAIDQCRRSGARLVVAKLDRLSRDVHFITGLQKSGVSFVCADMLEMDEFTAHIVRHSPARTDADRKPDPRQARGPEGAGRHQEGWPRAAR